MEKVIIIAEFSSSVVVQAIVNHIRFMESAGYEITVCVPDKKKNFINRFSSYRLFKYSSYRELRKIICTEENSESVIWCPDCVTILKLSIFNKKIKGKICYWVQGILPEESYLRNKNIVSKYLLTAIEYYALKKATYHVLVSTSMNSFLKHKYHLSLDKSIIIPCISDLKYVEKIKRIKNSFVYLGGMSSWQCFDKVLLIYKRIKENLPNSSFHIITLDIDIAIKKAKDVLGDLSLVEIYSINDRNKLETTLAQFEYGFLIREKNAINYVASPIKFAEYLSCGVNIIMTDGVPHFAKILKKYSAGYILPENKIGDFDWQHNYNLENSLNLYRQYFSLEKFVIEYRELFRFHEKK